MTRRRALLLAAAALLLTRPVAAQEGKVWRVGVLDTTPRAMNTANLDALRKGLQELGYVEGRNLIIHYRSADGNPARFPEMAKELVLEKVDLIVTRGTPSTRAAQAATATIPIVMTSVGSPERSGIAKSLARPGGNVTGLSANTAGLTAKRVELLREVFPRIARIGFLANMSSPNNQIASQEMIKAARSLGIEARMLDVRKAEDLPQAFELARKERCGALIIFTDTVTQTSRKAIADLALSGRLPTIAANTEFVPAGALMSYGPSTSKLYFRAAGYVDKILKGASPGDLPIEEPSTMELNLNLRTAKALGIKFPQSVEFRADKLIE